MRGLRSGACFARAINRDLGVCLERWLFELGAALAVRSGQRRRVKLTLVLVAREGCTVQTRCVKKLEFSRHSAGRSVPRQIVFGTNCPLAIGAVRVVRACRVLSFLYTTFACADVWRTRRSLLETNQLAIPAASLTSPMAAAPIAESPDLLSLLDNAAGHPSRVVFMTQAGRHETTFDDLWSASESAARYWSRYPVGASVAGLLTPSFDVIASFIGALRAGLDFISIPLPGRGQDVAAFGAQMETILSGSNAVQLVVDSVYRGIIEASAGTLEIPTVVSADSCSGGVSDAARLWENSGDIVQYSSGTTGVPKGVKLDGAAIGASVTATLDALDIRPGDGSCQWVPLSHDMGLVGGLFSGWAVACRQRLASAEARYCAMAPELFLARPLSWLEACIAEGGTVTSAPAFAYDILARQLPRVRDLDLSSLRVALCGAEPVHAAMLERFTRAAAPHGLSSTAICPAYGLAEATLAVAFSRPNEEWKTVEANIDGTLRTLVSCGRPVDSVDVALRTGEQGATTLHVRGAAVTRERIPGGRRSRDAWLDTRDMADMVGGELAVSGRADDMLCVAGRNVFAWELELQALECEGVRAGNCIVVPDDDGRYLVFVEAASGVLAEHLRGILQQIARRLGRFIGVAPAGVGCLPRGALPKTPSGKPRRAVVARSLAEYRERCVSFFGS